MVLFSNARRIRHRNCGSRSRMYPPITVHTYPAGCRQPGERDDMVKARKEKIRKSRFQLLADFWVTPERSLIYNLMKLDVIQLRIILPHPHS